MDRPYVVPELCNGCGICEHVCPLEGKPGIEVVAVKDRTPLNPVELAEAQTKGYAEADPTEDVGGFDARAKLAILMRLALRVVVDPEEIKPSGATTARVHPS